MSLGRYPDVTLAQAREMRREARSLLAQEIDPQIHKQKRHRQTLEARQNTLEAVAKKWLHVKKSKVKADTAEDIWRSLELHVFPTLGQTPIYELTAPAVIKILEPIAARGTLETVKRLTQRINEIMVYATNTGIIEHNRLSGISAAFQVPKTQNMPTIDAQAMPTLMQRLQDASINPVTRCLIEWQLHTMTRPSEAAGARWEEIDLAEALWTIPANRMKADKKHTVPLTKAVMTILQRMQPISAHRAFVFPSNRDFRKHINAATANMALKRMGYHGELVSHGLRSLASTTLNEQGFNHDVIEAALAHKDSNEVRAAYNRAQYIERRRALMESWSQQILAAKKGELFTPSIESLRIVNAL